MTTQKSTNTTQLVWDLPTRLSHWLMVVLFGFLIASGKWLEDMMQWHILSGYLLIGVVLFRIIWGFIGSYHARFISFLRSPKATLHYIIAMLKGQPTHYAGHNPAGAIMVVLLLLGLSIQASSGLITTDDIIWSGPLYPLVSETLASWGGTIHHWLEEVLIVLVVVHIVAVIIHKVKFQESLVPAMIHGYKRLHNATAVPIKVGIVRLLIGVIIAGTLTAWLWSQPL